MTDIVSREKRSEIMSKVSSKETKPEIRVRKYLFAQGFRFRKNDKRFAGKPDIILPKYKTAVFIHGCFWHHHDCKAADLPESNRDYWEKKILRNETRDAENQAKLEEKGWRVLTVWECAIKNKALFAETMEKLVAEIK